MVEALMFIAVIFVLWLLFEYWQIILPIIGAIIALIILIYIWDKKSEKNKKNKYLNHPDVKKELNKYFECIKLLYKSCQYNGGHMIISRFYLENFDIFEPDYKQDIPRVYTKINFTNTYSLEVYYKNACSTGDYEYRIWAENSLAKSIFNMSIEELEKNGLKNYFESISVDAKYSKYNYKLTMVLYIYPPSVEGMKLTQEIRNDYFTNKLERMYKEYLQQQKTPRR